jgi:2-polyprenyl-6-hydroxyphenyl methylase/3-demethylubiquinone-9 3-methyltransferase
MESPNASNALRLRPAGKAPVACKICGGPSPLYGVVDMDQPCRVGPALPLSGVPVYYRRCTACGFLFSDAFDDWGIDDFKARIYNDDYQRYDPDYKDKRPAANAANVIRTWSASKAGMRVLDYGGGNDVLCAALRANGFKEAVTYDPMVAQYAREPAGLFDLVTCFETLEHLPDPMAGIRNIVKFVADPGAVLFSTLVQPTDFDQQGMGWWYIGPRNGHLSIFTRQALALAWGQFGFKLTSFNDGVHLAFRTLPAGWNFKVQNKAAPPPPRN